MSEQLKQKSLSNQAAFCCSVYICLTILKQLQNQNPYMQFQIAWIPVEMTGFCPLKLAEQL